MVAPRGHSLVELLVVIAVGGVLMAAITTATSHAYRTTGAAIRRQESLAVTATVLDSLLSAPIPADGERLSQSIRSWWRVRPEGSGIRIDVHSAPTSGRHAASLSGFWLAPPPVLPPPDSFLAGIVP